MSIIGYYKKPSASSLLVPSKGNVHALMFGTVDVWGTPEDENSSMLFQPTPSITTGRRLNGNPEFTHGRKHKTKPRPHLRAIDYLDRLLEALSTGPPLYCCGPQ